MGDRGEPPDKSDPDPNPKVSVNRAIHMGIIAGNMGIYCHICIQIVGAQGLRAPGYLIVADRAVQSMAGE